MSRTTDHPRDGLHELLDGEISGEERLEVERHLASCERCRRELEALRALKAGAREAVSAPPLPPGFEARLRAALDLEDARATAPAPHGRRASWALAAVGVAAVALALVLIRQPFRARLVSAAATDFSLVAAGGLVLEKNTADAAALDAYFAEHGLRARVLDLEMMGWRLAGGRIHRVAGSSSALYVYQDQTGRRVVCQMFGGRLADLPGGGEAREHNGIAFRIYARDGLTVAFWQEGPLLCVLVSDIPREELVALAFAKAMRA